MNAPGAPPQATWHLPSIDDLLHQSRSIYEETDAELGDAKNRLMKLRMENAMAVRAKQDELEKDVYDKKRQVEVAHMENEDAIKEIQGYTSEIATLRSRALAEQRRMAKIGSDLKEILDKLTVAQDYADKTLERTGEHGDLDTNAPYQAFNELQAVDAARFALEEKQRKMDIIATTRNEASSQELQQMKEAVAKVDAVVQARSWEMVDAVLPAGELSLLQAGGKGIADDIEAMMRKGLANRTKTELEETFERQRDEQEGLLVDLFQRSAALEDQENSLKDRVAKLRTAVGFLMRRRKSMEANFHYLSHFMSFVGSDRSTVKMRAANSTKPSVPVGDV